MLTRTAHSWRDDAAVPPFDDSRPLIVFDGVCVFCSRSMRFIAAHEAGETFLFTPAQSPLGEALLRHFGLATGDFETMLVIVDGKAHAKRDGVVVIGRNLRLPWRWVLTAWQLLPGGLGDRLYGLVARNRYRLFGRYDHCVVPDPRWRARVIG